MSELNLTSAQMNAIAVPVGGTIVVSAGAGTGKTSVLSETVAKKIVCDSGIEISNVLVITFTNKAAREMAERIEKRLLSLAEHSDDVIQRERLFKAAEEIPYASIETLDSFAAKLLRENPGYSGIDPQFVILDENQVRLLGEKTAVDCFERWHKNPIHSELVSMIRDVGLDNWSELLIDIDQKLMTRGNPDPSMIILGREFAGSDNYAEILNSLSEKFKQELESKRTDVLARLDELEEQLKINILEDTKGDTKYSQISRDILKDIEPLRVWLKSEELNWDDPILESVRKWEKIELRGKPTDNRKESAASIRWIKGNITGDFDEKEKDNENEDTSDSLFGIAADIFLNKYRDALCRAILDFHASFLKARREANGMSFADLELDCVKILRNNPELLKTVWEKFKYVVVDEFQDINPLQKEFIFLLSQPSGNQPDLPSNLYVVGDERQSIYGFRNADSSIICELRERVSESNSKALFDCFRTRREILNFVNFVFSQVWSELGIHSDLKPSFPPYLEQSDAVSEGTIELHLIEAESASTGRRREAIEIANRIREIVENENRLVWGKGADGPFLRPVRYSDIAILMRTTDLFELYKEILSDCGVPCATEGGKGFWDSHEISDITALVNVVSNARTNLDTAILLRSPIVGLTDDTLLEISEISGRKGDWLDAVKSIEPENTDDFDKIQIFLKWFNEISAVAGRIPVSDLINEAMIRSGYYERIYSEPDGEICRANIEKLKSILKNDIPIFDCWTAGSYLRWLQKTSKSGKSGTSIQSDAVSISTIHGAKGLEWHIVVLPDLSRKRNDEIKRTKVLWTDDFGLNMRITDQGSGAEIKSTRLTRSIEFADSKAQEEELRLLYVALTRAREHLILSSHLISKTDKNDEKKWSFKLSDTETKNYLQVLSKHLSPESGLLGHPDDLSEINLSIPVADSLYAHETSRVVKETSLNIRRVIHKIKDRIPTPVIPGSTDTEFLSRLKSVADNIVRFPEPNSLRYIVSATEIVAYENCPAYYKYRSILQVPGLGFKQVPVVQESEFTYELDKDDADKFEPVFDIPWTLWGTINHAILERCDFDSDTKSIEKCCVEVLNEFGIDPNAYLPDKFTPFTGTRKTFIERLTEVVSQTMGLEIFGKLKSAKEIKREFRLIGKIPGTEEVINGTIDLLAVFDDGVMVADYKTGYVDTENPLSSAMHYRTQLILYSILAGNRYGIDPKDIDARIIYLSPAMDIRIPVNDETITETMKIVSEFIQSSSENNFPAKPSQDKCKWCDYRDICPDSASQLS